MFKMKNIMKKIKSEGSSCIARPKWQGTALSQKP